MEMNKIIARKMYKMIRPFVNFFFSFLAMDAFSPFHKLIPSDVVIPTDVLYNKTIRETSINSDGHVRKPTFKIKLLE